MYSLTALLKHAALAFILVFSASAIAQDEEKQTNTEDDLEFAIKLARNRYFDLANDFLARIKSGHLTEEEKDSVLVTNATILKLASEYSSTEEDRLASYNQAIAQFREFVQYNTMHAKYDEIRLQLAETLHNMGKFTQIRMSISKTPEAKAALQKEAEAAFRESIQLYDDVGRAFQTQYEAYQESGEMEMARKMFESYREAVYKKGIAYYFWGVIYPKDDEVNREDYLNRSVNTLDDYIWESEEDDFNALWAYLYQSMAYTEMGEFSDALDLAIQVYDPETGINLDQATQLPPELARLITNLAESAYRQVTYIYNEMGESQKACDTVDALVEAFESRSLEISPIGDEARLEQAKALLEMQDSEKTDQAAHLCKLVGDRNPTKEVGRQAKILLQRIIESSTSQESQVNISPDVLFSAAEGARLEKNFQDAIKAYMKVFQASKTVQQQETFSAKTWNAIGICYRDMDRYLESAVAFEQGFTLPNAKKDEKSYESNAMTWS